MVQTALAMGLIQLVALALPAFAILIEVMVESDFPYTEKAIPVIAVSFGFVLVAGLIVLGLLVFQPLALGMKVAIIVLGAGLTGLVLGIGLIALQTRRAQQRQAQ